MKINQQDLKQLLEDAFFQGCNYGFTTQLNEDVIFEKSRYKAFEVFYTNIKDEYKLIIKKCKYCGRYFIPEKLNSKYCNRKIDKQAALFLGLIGSDHKKITPNERTAILGIILKSNQDWKKK